ncbi:hypothetical protein B0T22DRAFT_376293 [Podospora appendiculata]|uniref:Tetratricopeptide repeat protein 1 n=1 Tax=Podospora appendiculata TaxID=314037 RepID=A0AAE1CC12_9PEZI|nr:hypothetical protein B0T22DRAFT_376293 [Podospora appendiculata]
MAPNGTSSSGRRAPDRGHKPVPVGQDYGDDAGDVHQPGTKLSPEEEAATESNIHKAEANSLFTSGKYDAAINKYDEALALCPSYLDFELAVLRSNIAACHLKLAEWKEAINNATTALDGLDRLEREEEEDVKARKAQEEEDEVAEIEIISPGAAAAGPPLPKPESQIDVAWRKRQDDIARIRAKALMRRGRARSELGGWSNLEGAVGDYKKLSTMTNLSPADVKIVQAQLRVLPSRAKTAQETETAEMWGKLKELGNGILKPFGLSTENFKMQKDEKTGGYSMGFEGGRGGGGDAK